MKIKTTIKTIFILTTVLFFGLSFNLLDFGFENEIILAQSFTCDSGDLNTTCYINTSHNITGETISGSGNLEIQNGGNLYTDQGEGTIAIINMGGSMEIKTGGKIEGNINLTASDLTIESGASISADFNGYGSLSGPGAGVDLSWLDGTNSIVPGTGASYGGVGGYAWQLVGNPPYGSLTEPTDMGSGGGIVGHATGGAGGGAIKLNISGTLRVDGSITSNGDVGKPFCGGHNNGWPKPGGGGSGGSIWIIANAFTGSGSITANGGDGGFATCGISNTTGYGCGGAGGRIALNYKDINFNGYFGVNGGDKNVYSSQQGSIYISSSDAGKVKIKNTPANINDFEGRGIERLGSIDAIITNYEITIPNGRSIKGNVEITASDLTIESGAFISADFNGYGSLSGPGAGVSLWWLGGTNSIDPGTGASYGGVGSYAWGKVGGPPYGSLTEPTDMGSGGGIVGHATGGAGGGAIKLNISGTLRVDGSITSNGDVGKPFCGGHNNGWPKPGGGGSGGSIWIIANAFTGSGSITANGGDGGFATCGISNTTGYGCGAGGGRIGIDCCEITHTGAITVIKGTGASNCKHGEDGTIHYGPCPCAFEGESCASMPCCLVPPASEPLTCVDNICRTCISKSCNINQAKDHSISEMGDAINDVYCTWNIHDGCCVKSDVETVDGSNNPDYWEGESCDAEPGTSNLWGEKKVYIDDINDYNIKGKVCVDDYNNFWINGAQVNVLENGSAGCTSLIDVRSFFHDDWNTIEFKAVDTCSGNRYMDIDWEIKPRAPALNGNANSPSEIKLTWSDRGADTYWLRRYNPDSTITDINVGSVITYDDDDEGAGLDANTLYSYEVMAIKNGYDSDWSNEVSATTFNQPPVAIIMTNGFDLDFYSMVIGSAVNLDGDDDSSPSFDPDGDPITYDWTFSSKPGGSIANFSNPTEDNQSFTPDAIGVYDIDLKVTDISGGSGTDTVSITVADPPPVPVCGNNFIEGDEECDGTATEAEGSFCPPSECQLDCTCQKAMPLWKEVHPKN